MKVKIEAISIKNKSFKTNTGKWYEYDNITEVEKGKWYEIELDSNNKKVISLKPSIYNPNQNSLNKYSNSKTIYTNNNAIVEPIKKFLSKKLFVDICSLSFNMAKLLAEKYANNLSEDEYSEYLINKTLFFAEELIKKGDKLNENTSERDKE